MNTEVSVVIMAAGLGTRMRSEKAKVLHHAGGDTILNHVLRAALNATTPDRIAVVVGHQAEQVQQSVTVSGIQFVFQPKQLGTGHAALCAREAVRAGTGSVLILNGDGPLLRPDTLMTLLQHRGRVSGAIVTTRLADPTGYGRIIRDENGMVGAIIEEKAATAEQKLIQEVNPGLYRFDAAAFWPLLDELTPNPASGEYYITDMVEILRLHGRPIAPMPVADSTELLGINTRVELAVADKILRTRKANELMLGGVTIEQPETTAIDSDVVAGQDTLIEANAQLRGRTRIGKRCVIGAGCVLRDCDVGDDVVFLPYVVAEASQFASGAHIGPFARLRMSAQVGSAAHVGNFVELKKTSLGDGSKANHLAYLGDAFIGSNVNIGAGTITCNYDGELKHPTNIEDGVFVGSNSTLVAPLKLEEGSYVAAGSVITKNVSKNSLALGRAMQVEKHDWAKRRRDSRQATKTNR